MVFGFGCEFVISRREFREVKKEGRRSCLMEIEGYEDEWLGV